jgi:hypothetical protein
VDRTVILLFNPHSTTPGKQPLPLSVLSLAAVIEGRERWALVDGNLTRDPFRALSAHLDAMPSGELTVVAITVMPGPQLTQAIAVSSALRKRFPHAVVVWGGYFPTQHGDTVLRAPYVDYVVRSQGERPLLELLDALRGTRPLNSVGSLSWRAPDGRVVHNPSAPMVALDELPDLPYDRVRMDDYLHATYLGHRTIAYNSSFGCPFSCSFCAVVAMTNRRWLAQSPARMARVLRHLVGTYGVDAVQMHDMDFFISEARVAEFAARIKDLNVSWWGLGRVDTLMQYSDATWGAMARSGLKMVFSGAEAASDATLAAMNKGGKASAALAIELARRMRSFGVVPEYSFVLGSPPDPEADLDQTFSFIRAIKRVNPATEIILYTYTPVPMESGMLADAARQGFAFPAVLDEWTSEAWQKFSLRRGDGVPWVDQRVRRRVRDFERVLNAYYPTTTDPRLTKLRRLLLRAASAWRYGLEMYRAPIELRALHRLVRYQRPETTGF